MQSNAFSRSRNVTLMFVCRSVFLNCLFQCENRICHAHNWHEPKLTVGALYHHLVQNSFPYFKSACSQYNVIKCSTRLFKGGGGAGRNSGEFF